MPDPTTSDTLIVTGGYPGLDTVTVFGRYGTVINTVRNLNQGRYAHSCGSFISSVGIPVSWAFQFFQTTKLLNLQTLIVAGGYSISLGSYISTTEKFIMKAGSPSEWVSDAPLPQGMEGTRIANLDNRLLLFGQPLNFYPWSLSFILGV